MTKTPPKLIIFAGANGSGKTTVAKLLLPRRRVKNFVNADDIARDLSPDNPTAQAVAAGRQVLKDIEALIRKKESFAIETTLAGRSHAALLKRAQKKGYKIEMYYIFCADINVNIQRVKTRVKQGGHDVPAQDIRRRYWRSLQNWLSPYKNLCDIIYLYDTTAGRPEEIASKKDEGGYVVFHEEWCQRFVKKVIEARDEH